MFGLGDPYKFDDPSRDEAKARRLEYFVNSEQPEFEAPFSKGSVFRVRV